MVWTHTLNPIAFSVAGIEVEWYAFGYVLSFILVIAYALWRLRLGKAPLAKKPLWTTMLWGALSLILGARLGYVLFYEPSYYFANPLEILQIWYGGFSFHGGLIGVGLALWYFSRRNNVPFLRLVDFFAVPLAACQIFGRIGNFISGELYGRPTTLSWGVVFPLAEDGVARHPSQLYEIGYNLLNSIIMFANRDHQYGDGFLTGLWMVVYGIGRFGVEFLREPDYWVGPLTAGQTLTIPVLAVGAYVLWRSQGLRGKYL